MPAGLEFEPNGGGCRGPGGRGLSLARLRALLGHIRGELPFQPTVLAPFDRWGVPAVRASPDGKAHTPLAERHGRVILWYGRGVVRFSVHHTMLLDPGAPWVIGPVADDMAEVFSRDEARGVGQELEFGPIFPGQPQPINFGLWHGTHTLTM
jgi:hypothetical protein